MKPDTVAKDDTGEVSRDHRLGNRTLSGMMWMFSGSFMQVVLRTLILVILARLLTPEDYGVVSAALVVVSFAQLFSELGVGPALIQRPQLEERHLRTAFTIFTLSGLMVGALIALSAPLVAAFFKIEELVPVLWVAALAFPLQGLSAVPTSLLTRDLKFRYLSAINVATYAVGYGAVGIIMALMGFGVWALVGATLGRMLLSMVVLLFLVPFPKRPMLERQAFRELMYFGGGFTLASIFGYVAMQGDYMVVGRWLGASALGLYNRAYNLLILPASHFGQVLDQVLFPSMAKVQDDQERLRLAYRYGMAVVALVIMPISVASIIMGQELILVMLGPQWLGVAVPFRILAIGMLFRTSARINSSLARATGKIYKRAWREGVYAALVLVGAFVGQRWGLEGVAAGVLFAVTAHFVIMTQFSLSLVSMSWGRLVTIHVPAMILTVIAGAEVWILATFLRGMEVPALLLLLIVGLITGLTLLGLTRLFPTLLLGEDGIAIFAILRRFLQSKLARKRQNWRRPAYELSSQSPRASRASPEYLDSVVATPAGPNEIIPPSRQDDSLTLSGRNLMATRFRAIQGRVWVKTLALSRKIGVPWRNGNGNSIPAFLVGCGRSGTNMVVRRLSQSWHIEPYGEENPAAFDHYRLKDMATVKRLVSRSRSDVTLFKPILDTHLTRQLLNVFPTSRVIFMVRHYADVINSSLARFGAEDWPSRVDSWISNDFAEFASAPLPEDTKKAVRALWNESLSPESKIALYWLAYNRLYFDLNLHNDERVYLLQYEVTVLAPEQAFQSLCGFLGVKYQASMPYNIRTSSIQREAAPLLDGKVEASCEQMWRLLCERTGQQTQIIGVQTMAHPY